MAGYIGQVFFACLWTETESRSKVTRHYSTYFFFYSIVKSAKITVSRFRYISFLEWGLCYGQTRRQGEWESHWTKGLISRTMPVHVSLFISLQSSQQQLREMTNFLVFSFGIEADFAYLAWASSETHWTDLDNFKITWWNINSSFTRRYLRGRGGHLHILSISDKNTDQEQIENTTAAVTLDKKVKNWTYDYFA